MNWQLTYRFECRLCGFMGSMAFVKDRDTEGLDKFPEDKPTQAYWPNYCPNCGGELDHTRKSVIKTKWHP